MHEKRNTFDLSLRLGWVSTCCGMPKWHVHATKFVSLYAAIYITKDTISIVCSMQKVMVTVWFKIY